MRTRMPLCDRPSAMLRMLRQNVPAAKPYPTMHKAVCDTMRGLAIELRTALAESIAAALKNARWSKREGESFELERVSTLRDVLAAMDALQRIVSNEHYQSQVGGALPIMDVGLPPPPAGTLGRVQASRECSSWMVDQLVRPLATRLYFHFDEGGSLARMDRPHFLYSFAATTIADCVAFLQEHVGGSKGSLYGDALRARLVAAFPDSTPDLGGEDEPCVPATSRDWSIVSDICTSFTDVAIGVVNDIMEGRVEDSGLATRPSDWMASVRSAMEFDAKLESSWANVQNDRRLLQTS